MSTQDSYLFQQVLASFKAQLGDPDLLAKFQITSVQDLKDEIFAIQSKHVSERRVQNMRRLECFVTAMESYGEVIEVFLNVSDILAFVWVRYKFLLGGTKPQPWKSY
ncbi:hypothetical protein N7528_004017 [Penicillium herquei]|nr:hypothetical protein N7528_004017 [Penicillium herquei]